MADSSVLVFANPLAQTYAGQISGSGSVTKTAVGTLVLDGTSTYSGGTTIAAGTLQLGDGVAKNGAISGNVADSSVLVFANPLGQTYTGQISGSGSLTKTAAGTLVLSGSNSYTGGTTITAGTLQLGRAISIGYLQGNVANSGVLVFANALGQTYAGQISGSGSLTKSAAGILVLNGANTYTGGTTIAAGTLQLGDGASITAPCRAIWPTPASWPSPTPWPKRTPARSAAAAA